MSSIFRSSLGAVLALGCVNASMAQASQPAGVLFENVRIFDGASERLSSPSSVLVVGKMITAISTAPIAAPSGRALTRIEGGGRTLMPGLIDNHVHITLSASSQRDLIDPKVNPEVLQARATEEARQILLRGFTAVRDLGGPVFELKAAIDAAKTPGPRIYPSGAMISQTSGHGDTRLPNERSRRFFGAVSRGGTAGRHLYRRRPRRGADRNTRKPARRRQSDQGHGGRRRGVGV